MKRIMKNDHEEESIKEYEKRDEKQKIYQSVGGDNKIINKGELIKKL